MFRFTDNNKSFLLISQYIPADYVSAVMIPFLLTIRKNDKYALKMELLEQNADHILEDCHKENIQKVEKMQKEYIEGKGCRGRGGGGGGGGGKEGMEERGASGGGRGEKEREGGEGGDDARDNNGLAVKARFGVNEESKKMRRGERTMRKQPFTKFSVTEEEGLHKVMTGFKDSDQLKSSQARQTNMMISPEVSKSTSLSFIGVKSARSPTHFCVHMELPALAQSLLILITRNVPSSFSRHRSFLDNLNGNVFCIPLLLRMNKRSRYDLWSVNVKTVDDKARAYRMLLKHKESQKDWYHKTQMALEEKIRVLTANLENTTNTLSYTETLHDQAQKEKKEWEVKTKVGLGFKEYFGENEVFDLSRPSTMYPEPVEQESNPLYSRFVKAGEMHAVPPSITGTYMPSPYKSDMEKTQVSYGSKSDNKTSETISESNDFVSCDNSDKSSDSATYASCDSSLKTKTKDFPPAVGITTLPESDVEDPNSTTLLLTGSPSFPCSENVKSPRLIIVTSKDCIDSVPCKSQAASVPKLVERRTKPTERVKQPAGWSKRPAPVSAGGPVSAGWLNPAARPYFRPSSVHFNNMYWPNVYDPIGIVKYGGEMVEESEKAPIKRTSSLNLQMIYYVEELQHFNLFSVPQIGDKKNKSYSSQTLDCLVAFRRIPIACESVLLRIPHNKTPYELISGKVPQISHLKPFGCQVTILNTSDYLGKFEGKADEGYLVGYASNERPIGFIIDPTRGTQETNIPAGTQAQDSDSDVEEQVIVVPSFPSNSFAGPSSSNGPSIMERNADYAEELAKLQRQEYAAKGTQLHDMDLLALGSAVWCLSAIFGFVVRQLILGDSASSSSDKKQSSQNQVPKARLQSGQSSVWTSSAPRPGNARFFGFSVTNTVQNRDYVTRHCSSRKIPGIYFCFRPDINVCKVVLVPDIISHLSVGSHMSVIMLVLNGDRNPLQVLWIQNQLLDYGFNFMNTKIFIDNQSTICIVKNPVFHQRTKHIEIRHHFIRDANEKNLIQVLKIHTDDNVADLLTKAFDGPRFAYLVVHIGMVDMLVSAGCTMVLLVVILPAGRMVSAGCTMVLLVVILPAGCFVSDGCIPAVCMVSAVGGLFLLAEYIHAAGVVYAANTSIHAAGLVCAGSIMFLLADLFLLVVTCFCCAQLDIAGWLVSATSHLVSAGSLHSCWCNNVSAA
ncbi:hypothetical protein Tco_0775543 [Tanacetum coccineum]